jgi:hypothetical protein
LDVSEITPSFVPNPIRPWKAGIWPNHDAVRFRQLLQEALAATGMDQPEELVHLALREIISRRREGGSAVESHSEANKELAKLFGSWSEEEYRQIQGAIDEERRIDKGLK